MSSDELVEKLENLDYKYKLGEEAKAANFGIGIVGAGRIANQRQIRAYQSAGLRVVAVADIKPEAVESTKQRWGIEKGFLDHRELLELEEVDIVDVLTPTFPRPAIVQNAAQAGKHVISEKPFARSYRDALEMVEAAEQAGVKLAVHQPSRWYYPIAVAKCAIEEGCLGKPFFVIDEMIGCQDTSYWENPVTRWHVPLDDFLHVEWGAHHFDLLRFWLKEEPKSVYASCTKMPGQHFKSDMACVYSVNFPSGVRAGLVFNQVSQGKGYHGLDWHFRIDGSEGTVRGDHAVDCEFYNKQGKVFEWKWDYDESVNLCHVAPMAELINSIVEGREPSNSGRDNLKTVKTYLAAKLSAQEGRLVKPEEIK